MFIDTHCHLDFDIFDNSRIDILSKCDSLNVNYFINPATEFSKWDKLIDINTQFSNISICFGLHPSFTNNHQISHLDSLEKFTIENNCKLIGEIGLDKRFNIFDKQLDIFARQIDIAKNLQKPVIIHSVKSHNETIKTIKDTKFTNGGIIHAFNGNIDIAQTYIDLGFKLGIGSIVSQPTNKLKNILAEIGYQNIVLETDSPDMPLFNSSDKINTPTTIIDVFNILENIYIENTDILMKEIYKNSLAFI